MKLPEKIDSLCFTGHRDLSVSEADIITERILRLIPRLINRGLKNIYAGGAIGTDTAAALAILKAKESFPELRLNLILPCQGQESSWNDEQKKIYRDIKDKADSVRVLSPVYYNGCMQMRNREMLERSDLCIAYLRAGTSGGGSLNTVLQAIKMGVPVINLADAESEEII